jgi:hypothetical protein
MKNEPKSQSASPPRERKIEDAPHPPRPEGVPPDAIHDEPMGAPSSDRYHTEIATAKPTQKR